MAIAWAELNFRKQFLKDGHQLSELKYKTPWYPVVPYFAFIRVPAKLDSQFLVDDPAD